MVKSTHPPANGFVRAMRLVYNPLGFGKGYNFVLFFISMGYLFGFTLARLQYLNFNGVFCRPGGGAVGAAPGECYYWLQDPFKVGMKLHLYCILPAAFLVVFQFVPAIRHKVILFHRLNGYVIVILTLISNAGTIIIARHAFGGDFSTQVWAGTMVILTTVGFIMAWVNIKLLQIDQHRAWMMRAWAWIVTGLGPASTLEYYPGCATYFDGTQPDKRVIVNADFASEDPIALSASLAIPFGTAGWLALILHTIAIELYLRLTPVESDRLRRVSYERQLERGFKRPGYSGLVAERFGDAAPYVHTIPVKEEQEYPHVDEESGPRK
ncbi:hypothetical protein LTR56_010377 [Elasticomyces elasticus]|nr:hypothetical protein LTR56_010377 [Elasticomyces elasticus]KAK3656944.1 hypothetical protein LTR22_009607 [Elasticomyces elasticus]KAK5766176.1 hypothetical protein LTS12_003660 [Elasticomyces elasticus]